MFNLELTVALINFLAALVDLVRACLKEGGL